MPNENNEAYVPEYEDYNEENPPWASTPRAENEEENAPADQNPCVGRTNRIDKPDRIIVIPFVDAYDNNFGGVTEQLNPTLEYLLNKEKNRKQTANTLFDKTYLFIGKRIPKFSRNKTKSREDQLKNEEEAIVRKGDLEAKAFQENLNLYNDCKRGKRTNSELAASGVFVKHGEDEDWNLDTIKSVITKDTVFFLFGHGEVSIKNEKVISEFPINNNKESLNKEWFYSVASEAPDKEFLVVLNMCNSDKFIGDVEKMPDNLHLLTTDKCGKQDASDKIIAIFLDLFNGTYSDQPYTLLKIKAVRGPHVKRFLQYNNTNNREEKKGIAIYSKNPCVYIQDSLFLGGKRKRGRKYRSHKMKRTKKQMTRRRKNKAKL